MDGGLTASIQPPPLKYKFDRSGKLHFLFEHYD